VKLLGENFCRFEKVVQVSECRKRQGIVDSGGVYKRNVFLNQYIGARFCQWKAISGSLMHCVPPVK
jgi:hypothetical protein